MSEVPAGGSPEDNDPGALTTRLDGEEVRLLVHIEPLPDDEVGRSEPGPPDHEAAPDLPRRSE